MTAFLMNMLSIFSGLSTGLSEDAPPPVAPTFTIDTTATTIDDTTITIDTF